MQKEGGLSKGPRKFYVQSVNAVLLNIELFAVFFSFVFFVRSRRQVFALVASAMPISVEIQVSISTIAEPAYLGRKTCIFGGSNGDKKQNITDSCYDLVWRASSGGYG